MVSQKWMMIKIVKISINIKMRGLHHLKNRETTKKHKNKENMQILSTMKMRMNWSKGRDLKF